MDTPTKATIHHAVRIPEFPTHSIINGGEGGLSDNIPPKDGAGLNASSLEMGTQTISNIARLAQYSVSEGCWNTATVVPHGSEAPRIFELTQLVIETSKHCATLLVESIETLKLCKADGRIDLGRSKIESCRNEQVPRINARLPCYGFIREA